VTASGRDTATGIGAVEVSESGPVKRWQVDVLPGVSKVRKCYRQSGFAPVSEFGVHNNSTTNLVRGLYERVLYRVTPEGTRPPPAPSVGAFDTLAPFREAVCRHLGPGRRYTREAIVGMYTGRLRTVYQRAAESLAVKPLCRADGFVSTFVKCEKVDFLAKADPAPRVIQPRSPRYNLEVARYLKAMEKRLCKAIAEVWGGPTILKGMNAQDQAKCIVHAWEEFTDPVAIFFDATRFDQHVSVPALEFEHSVYLSGFSGKSRDTLAALLKWQLENVGYGRTADGLVKYIVDGRRMSGDINTGMGNCLLMCAMMWGFVQQLRVKSRLINNGDDCCLIVERRHLEKITSQAKPYFLKFGIDMKVDGHSFEVEGIKFCQTSPVHDGTCWTMVRNPVSAMAKDCISVLPLCDVRTHAAWAWAVGSGGLAAAGGMPVWHAFYAQLQKSGNPSNVGKHGAMQSGLAHLGAGLDRGTNEVTQAARHSFWRAFGILPDVQESLEAHYRTIPVCPSAGELPPQHIPSAY